MSDTPSSAPEPAAGSGPAGWPPSWPPSGPAGGSEGNGRRRVVVAVLAAVLVVAGAVLVPLLIVGGDDEPGTGDDAETAVPATASASRAEPSSRPTRRGGDPRPAPSPSTSFPPVKPGDDLSAVKVYNDLPSSHVDYDIAYDPVPPVGGPHAPTWIECGVYDEPIREENGVHDLEHGSVWITYDAAKLDADDIDALADALPDNGIMSPYPGIPAPVVVTVWGRQLLLTGADDPRLQLFIDEYAGSSTAPEPFFSCDGGISPEDAVPR
ncbi:DUF3105 domain-containing protein [Nocardioides marinquilinus]|uniref:DUF3105 domain-containing protein n=1 Tax=Nocardioides marinquilinus TaxID=1210400 RepID=UPI0031E88E9E